MSSAPFREIDDLPLCAAVFPKYSAGMRIASVVLGLVLAAATLPGVVSATDVIGQAEYGPAAPAATVNKSQMTPGEMMTLTGSGFPAFVPVVATIVPSASGFPKTGTTNGSGVVSWTFPAPPAGDYTVTITQRPGSDHGAGDNRSRNHVDDGGRHRPRDGEHAPPQLFAAWLSRRPELRGNLHDHVGRCPSSADLTSQRRSH